MSSTESTVTVTVRSAQPSPTPQAMEPTADQGKGRDDCEKTTFRKNGIVFGHHSDSSTETAVPPGPTPATQQDKANGQNSDTQPLIPHAEGCYLGYDPPGPQGFLNGGCAGPHTVTGQGYYWGAAQYQNSVTAPSPVEVGFHTHNLDAYGLLAEFHQSQQARLREPNHSAGLYSNGALAGMTEPFRSDMQPCAVGPMHRIWEYGHQGHMETREPPPPVKEMINHFLNLFVSGERTDYCLNLMPTKEGIRPQLLGAHSVVMCRNKHLNALIKKIEAGEHPKTINLTAERGFADTNGFYVALQNLYGAVPMTEQQFKESYPGSAGQMKFALSYLSSGAFLADRDIVHGAIDLIKGALSWDNVETLVHFGLVPGQYLIACNEEYARDSDSNFQSESSGDESVDTRTNFRIDDTYRAPRPDNPFLSAKTLNNEMVKIWAPRLLRWALRFMTVDSAAARFEFDAGARPTVTPDRLGWTQDEDHTTAEMEGRIKNSTDKNRAMSALLITLPYRYLKYTFRLMREWGLLSAKLAREVVAERELRCKSMKQKLELNSRDEKGLSRRSRGPLGWEEFVVEENENITVSRIWKGIGTAASAGKGPRSAEPGRPNGKM
ncbi:hypothetical protein CIHG_07724 [Coccidioides immitis H538.4]|uniref:BTB domain-containing protein n=1 Tax=Coccidioides immitis H538.4 TaxID=396776 RepID=A0A0J8RXZ2_COCIT|nr:hypothetical protein CIHG_07724 [Coccidioides immitis H538.4]